MLIFNVFFFILGTLVGSFLNVIILRLKSKESILKNRSHCPFCRKKLSWYELIPIISFIIQKGKCRHCHKKISLQYPLVECFTALTFLLIFKYQFSIFNLLIVCFLIVIFVYDLKYYLVPNQIIYPAIVLTFGFRISDLFRISDFGFRIWLDYLAAAIIGGAFFLAIVLISRGKWMGLGDVKIGVLMGLILGIKYLFVALFLAFLSGAIISIILLILKKKTWKSEIPFGPFLTGATFITLLWGNILIEWYLNLICLR
jgi:leader peptidase (prepilin peptidase)/N-methyltransferase